MNRLAGQEESEVSTDPITKKKSKPCLPTFPKYMISLISESLTQSSKSKLLVNSWSGVQI